ncbi:MAG: pyrroline-5-carboxylate reductase [Thomasclavelia sp.]|jgi:pyrroline-5-carboxylate reductase|nr:pyrroline-5-carboxylate reductase [Thomasclavelia sp.]
MKIGFIGMGNMASAIAGGIIDSKFIDGKDVYAYDIDNEKLNDMNKRFNLNPTSSLNELVKKVDLIVFAVKPNVIEAVVEEIVDDINDKIIVSIVNGYDFYKYEELLNEGTKHVTIMPNTPALVKQGMTLVEKENTLDESQLEYVINMLNSIGEVQVLPGYQFKAGSALSGCGPAYVYMMIEALADGAVLEGLPRDVAYKLASQTVIGSGMMQKKTNIHPGVLKDNVCSPGGITIKGVETLEEANFRNAVIKAVKASK